MKIIKVLSFNDSGETGSHQSGILVPKISGILDFFPKLDSNELNPRTYLDFQDNLGNIWKLSFIHYNNKKFGGTRNEYRLTRIAKYIKQEALFAGDEIIFEISNGKYYLSCQRTTAKRKARKTLIIGSGWRTVKI